MYAVGIIQPGAVGPRSEKNAPNTNSEIIRPSTMRSTATVPSAADAEIAAPAEQAGAHELAEARGQGEDRHEPDRRDREQRAGGDLHAERREQVVPAQRAA